ncbi:hypothetical protein CLAVI_000893 [Candidatus Clavichlamydia salmonicola]|uniref:hypothetical protein n=1 Tax=Candidatus Clavichlamydia salmonicola TaxID=469812 RepID=UPI00189110E1|nr:hypothetical protein [Candidatus Clavichlamydia salmonicola]MBF5051252.1 hypothetical protein [Candidatus Clavichlamydia salmonicola]
MSLINPFDISVILSKKSSCLIILPNPFLQKSLGQHLQILAQSIEKAAQEQLSFTNMCPNLTAISHNQDNFDPSSISNLPTLVHHLLQWIHVCKNEIISIKSCGLARYERINSALIKAQRRIASRNIRQPLLTTPLIKHLVKPSPEKTNDTLLTQRFKFLESEPLFINLQLITKKLEKALPYILERRFHPLIARYYNISSKYIVFQLRGMPHIICKAVIDITAFESHITNSKTIAKIIEDKNYDKIIIPQSHILEITSTCSNTVIFYLEKKTNLPKNAQNHALNWPISPKIYGWTECDDKLRPAFIQLAHIIQETGLCNINRNNCLAVLDQNTWKLVLVDTETVKPSSASIMGSLLDLISHVSSPTSAAAIIESCKPELMPQIEFCAFLEKLKEKSIPILEETKQFISLKNKYISMQQNLGNIGHPFKPITVTMNTLELNLSQTTTTSDHKKISLKTVLKKVIIILNQLLLENSTCPNAINDSPRLVNLPTYLYNVDSKDYIPHPHTTLNIYDPQACNSLALLGLSAEEKQDYLKKMQLMRTSARLPKFYLTHALQYQKKTWLHQIITALQNQGYILTSDYMEGEEVTLLNTLSFMIQL